MKRSTETATAAFLILLALGLSLVYVFDGIGHFDADEAIVGLMARHILQGRVPVYFYGQGYMGSLEALAAAAWFILLGPSIAALKLAPLTFYILFLVLQYRLLRRYGSLRSALLTLAITVVFSAVIILWTTKARGGFTAVLFFGTLAYLLAFRLIDRIKAGQFRWRNCLPLGIAAGLGFWTCGMVAYYFFPILIYFLFRGTREARPFLRAAERFWAQARDRRRTWKPWIRRSLSARYPHLAALAGVGLIYFLIAGVIRLVFLQTPGYEYGHHQTVAPAASLPAAGENLSLVFTRLLPAVTGISRVAFKFDPGNTPLLRLASQLNRATLSAAAGLAVIFLVAAVSSKHRRDALIRNRRLEYFFALSAAGCLLAMAFTSQVQDTTAFRYLIPMVSWLPFFLALLIIRAGRLWRPAGPILAAAVLGGHIVKLAPEILHPRPTSPEPAVPMIIETLREAGLTRVRANYWIAYPINFLTGERIIAAPYRSQDRYPPYSETVEISDEVAYVYRGFIHSRKMEMEKLQRDGRVPVREEKHRWGYLVVTRKEDNR